MSSISESRAKWNEKRRISRLEAGMRPVRPTKGLDDAATTHPHLRDEWHSDNANPLSHYRAGSGFRAKWLCPEGHVWTTKISHRTTGHGCGICARPKMSDDEYRERKSEQFRNWYYGRDPEEARTLKSRNARVQAVNREYGSVCYLCRVDVDLVSCHVDHVIPRSLGGPDILWNLRIVHPLCNWRKGDKTWLGPVWSGYLHPRREVG